MADRESRRAAMTSALAAVLSPSGAALRKYRELRLGSIVFGSSWLLWFLTFSLAWELGGNDCPFTAVLGLLLIGSAFTAAAFARHFVDLRASWIAVGSPRHARQATRGVGFVAAALSGSTILLLSMTSSLS